MCILPCFYHNLSVTTPSSRKEEMETQEKLKNMPEMTLVTEKWNSNSQICTLSQCSLQKESLFRNINLTIGLLGLVTKANSLNISLADVKGFLEGRAVEDGSWLILRRVQLESHVDA